MDSCQALRTAICKPMGCLRLQSREYTNVGGVFDGVSVMGSLLVVLRLTTTLYD